MFEFPSALFVCGWMEEGENSKICSLTLLVDAINQSKPVHSAKEGLHELDSELV